MNENTFNPTSHLIRIKSGQVSKDYLPVQWRLVWFRSLCPDGTIETKMVHLDLDRETEEEVFAWNNETRRSEKVVKRANGFVIFRAIVKDGKGGIATGTKSEKAASFSDYIEKAETGAIGRALAALGYGTQFTGDDLDEAHRIVDAPVDRGAPVESGSENGQSNGNGYKAIPKLRPVTSSNGNGTAKTSSSGNGSSGRTASSTSADIDASALATEQQIASIRKLCDHLGKAEPEKLEATTYANAKELIAQLSQEYRQSRKAS
jgi:hypothetical protein